MTPETEDSNSERESFLPLTGKGRFSGAVSTVGLWLCAAVVVGLLGWVLFDILRGGFSQLTWEFLSVEPEDAGRAGGISTVLVSTLLILAVALAVAVPISLAAAVELAERNRNRSMFARIVRKSLDVLAAVPSIVFGLFGNAFFCIFLGMGYSILSGGLTLACMILPIMTRLFEQAITAVPNEYRFAASSLGLSKSTTILRVVLPSAAPAMTAGIVLSIGRALAETAALIFTAGSVTRMPESVKDSGRALSVHIYDLAMNVSGGNSKAYATAAVLVVLLLVVNGLATLVIRWSSVETDSWSGVPR